MQRRILAGALILADMAIIAIVPFIGLFIRFEGSLPPDQIDKVFAYLPAAIAIQIVSFYFFGLYHRLWRYASVPDMLMIGSAVTIGSILVAIYSSYMIPGFSRSLYFINWILTTFFIGTSRMGVRIMRHILIQQKAKPSRVLIIGAGDAGAIIAREILNRYHDTKTLVGFIDDSALKQEQMMYGVKVLGTTDEIEQVAGQLSITEIIIAMPSVSGSIMRGIIQSCKHTGCDLKIVPGIYELIDGQVTVQQLRKVELEDLLGRDPVKLDLTQIEGYLQGKVVLVTGAGGSIGSEICRQIAKMKAKQILLLGKGENSIYEIHQELMEKFPVIHTLPIIADVRDKERITSIFGQYRPQVVFHAAAHKHVPLMEAHPVEAVKNNIFGTKNVAEAADRSGSEIFIMISTDKAVNPTSVMGATKRVAEQIIQQMNSISSTKFAAVRFGNVLGSRGSVIPLFKKQIAAGGPITITHPDMVRYFMTIPEACQLVLQAGSQASGGEVFVLDMGEPVKIVDMAVDLIRLSGLKPHQDIQIKFTGLRPGEKLFEELLTAAEGTTATKHAKIFTANLRQVDQAELEEGLFRLQLLEKTGDIIAALEALLPTYQAAREKYGHSA